MESNQGKQVVDPEVQAFVSSLVNAVGGKASDEHGHYILGDDALACLKDIKRWLRLHDGKANRFDVARCLAEADFVPNDLLEILAAWPEDASPDSIRSKIALASLDLLMMLTWPLEMNDAMATRNHHRHLPVLNLAQISYKRQILQHSTSSILRTAVQLVLPSIALPREERTPRNDSIIKLLLYVIRNVAAITAPQNLSVEWNEREVSRSATIEAFQQQDILPLLLTIASNIGDDFNTEDVAILEILFHLLKGVDVDKVFLEEDQVEANNAQSLKTLLVKESTMLRGYSKRAPSRHNRFGTMIWVKRDDERVSAVSGQDILMDNQQTLDKMDQSKKWNKPIRRGPGEATVNDFDRPTPLSPMACKYLREFVEDFLDSAFNPLFNHLRRAIERETERVLDSHAQQFFYLIAWFLKAERTRRKRKQTLTADPDSFAIIASVLNQETFILLNRVMQDRLDTKQWHEVNAGMQCLTQILLIVQEVANSPLEEDQEIAENIQNRIFYEETTHDRIIAILRGYKHQGFSYLDACTELSHVFLRMLEKYSKENTDLQVRSLRRVRRKEAIKGRTDQDAHHESEVEDLVEAQRVSKERKFDFTRFARKFTTQACVNTFATFTSYYKDLTDDQLKRAHRFFYRAAFKQQMSTILFRVDIIALFHRMIKGQDGLPTSSAMYREWDEMTRQLLRRMIKALQKRPALAVELLFSKINSSLFYLEHGYDQPTITSQPRPPATLEVKGAMTRDEQIGVVIAILHETKLSAVDFVKMTLSKALDERQSWEAEASARALESQSDQVNEASRAPSTAVLPDSNDRRIAMFKDNKLRLLMSLCGFERIGEDTDMDASWIIPSTIAVAELRETLAMVEKHRNDPIMEYGDEDPMPAQDMLRRKAVRKARTEFDDDSDGDEDQGPEDFLFPAGGPTNRQTQPQEVQKRRRKRINAPAELDDETKMARATARRERELEKQRKLKSNLLVHASDDDDDEERDRAFFEREEQRRQAHWLRVTEELKAKKARDDAVAVSKKRKAEALTADRSKHSGPSTRNDRNLEGEMEDLSSDSDSQLLDSEGDPLASNKRMRYDDFEQPRMDEFLSEGSARSISPEPWETGREVLAAEAAAQAAAQAAANVGDLSTSEVSDAPSPGPEDEESGVEEVDSNTPLSSQHDTFVAKIPRLMPSSPLPSPSGKLGARDIARNAGGEFRNSNGNGNEVDDELWEDKFIGENQRRARERRAKRQIVPDESDDE